MKRNLRSVEIFSLLANRDVNAPSMLIISLTMLSGSSISHNDIIRMAKKNKYIYKNLSFFSLHHSTLLSFLIEERKKERSKHGAENTKEN